MAFRNQVTALSELVGDLLKITTDPDNPLAPYVIIDPVNDFSFGPQVKFSNGSHFAWISELVSNPSVMVEMGAYYSVPFPNLGEHGYVALEVDAGNKKVFARNYYQPPNAAPVVISDSPPLEDTGWIAPTLLNGWSNFGGGHAVAGYRRMNGVVHLKGLIKSGTIGGVAALNLPAGFRPAEQLLLPGADGTNATNGRIDIYPNGDVQMVSGNNAFFGLNGICFPADA